MHDQLSRSRLCRVQDEEEGEVKLYSYEGEREPAAEKEISVGEKKGTYQPLGARSGKGVATFPNGDTYEGEYTTGQRHGQGKYTYSGGPPAEEGDEPPPPKGVYEGSWANDKKQGLGVMVYADGTKYHGNWERNKFSGQGAFYYANGDIYAGEWARGQKNGTGTYIYKATQTHLKGVWVNGVCQDGVFSDQVRAPPAPPPARPPPPCPSLSPHPPRIAPLSAPTRIKRRPPSGHPHAPRSAPSSEPSPRPTQYGNCFTGAFGTAEAQPLYGAGTFLNASGATAVM